MYHTMDRRFWDKVDIRGKSDCWEWTAGKYPTGYGVFWVNGKNRGAHRVAWMLTYGDSLGRYDFICHKCDNPGCVNPSHLFKRTPKDNMADKLAKGRQNLIGSKRPGISGQKNHNSKLTPEDVLEIRAVYSKGKRGSGVRRLAKKYSVRPFTIYRVVNNLTWRNL